MEVLSRILKTECFIIVTCTEERQSEYSLAGIMSSCVTYMGCQVLQVKGITIYTYLTLREILNRSALLLVVLDNIRTAKEPAHYCSKQKHCQYGHRPPQLHCSRRDPKERQKLQQLCSGTFFQMHPFESSKIYIVNSHPPYSKMEMQVCPPGLHISLGIFYRLFQLMEDECHVLDNAVSWFEDSRERGGPSYSNFMSDSVRERALKDELDR